MRKYGSILLAIANVIIWIAIYVDDFYQMEFYFKFGAVIVAFISLLWAKRDPEMKFKKLTYAVSGLFLLLYLVFWGYIILLAIGFSER